MSKLIVIEGLDGSGKSTQLKMLRAYLEQKNVKYKYIHFPRLEEGVFGDLIARFLRGEFGSLEQVNPYLVALLYAGDRSDVAQQVKQWIQDDYLVVFDRYVHSNIAYQCAKLTCAKEIEKLHAWILNLEFEYYKIPMPDLSVFLHVPISFVKSRLFAERQGEDRSYLQGAKDIHESSMDFQQRVEDEYLRIAGSDDTYQILNCIGASETMLSADSIHANLITLLKQNSIL